jgi:hypothetical protein
VRTNERLIKVIKSWKKKSSVIDFEATFDGKADLQYVLCPQFLQEARDDISAVHPADCVLVAVVLVFVHINVHEMDYVLRNIYR